jgi:hypothetical protein
MTYRTRTAIVLVGLAQGFVGCDGSGSSSAPSVVSQTGVQPAALVSGISGFVMDTGFRALPGATIEVIDGPQAGTSTIADANGQFSLTGAFDATVRFRATKADYVTATQPWSCSVETCPGPNNARPWLGFYLAPRAPSVNIAGSYTLTFVADAACADLPQEARTRTYAATIAPESKPNVPANSSFSVTVSGATFLANFDRFSIGVAEDYLGFWLDGGHNPPLIEQLAPNRLYAISGSASASVGRSTVSTISTSFDGWIEHCELKSALGRYYECSATVAVTRARCESRNHRLILTRQ